MALLKSKWNDWAREWGLAHYPETGWLRRTERVLGQHRGLLIRVNWGSDQNPGLNVLVRFPKSPNLERVRDALIADAGLDLLPGKGAARRKMKLEGTGPKFHLGGLPEFYLGDNGLLWRRTFAFKEPSATQVKGWVDALVAAVARATPPFDGRCETCATGVARQYVVANGVPTMMCTSCQQELQAAGDMAERTYDLSEARHVPGFALATVGALLGALAWAAIGAATQRIFAAAAIGIGALIAWAYKMGAGRVDAIGRAVAVCLTIASVVLGEVLLLTWWVKQSNPAVGFNLDAVWYAYQKM